MSVDIGTRLGSLEITALLGKGGMGEVYRARDAKLKREVAIKILPGDFSNDTNRVSRFQREAEVLASLNHPNIAAIYDLQEANGSRFLILELVEGETLAERIERGSIPINEAIDIAKHICGALEAAHDRGIVHRDLKPGNVKVTPDGKVKVLDFGLAKISESEVVSADVSNSPTLMTAGSMPGIIIGTAAYMSPEQAKGRQVDRRTDIFAFGCVLYEMLTGRQAFGGEDVPDILSRILQRDPDWSALPPDLSPQVATLLRRCLEKDLINRRRDIGDVRMDIEQALQERTAGAVSSNQPANSRSSWVGRAAAGLLIAALSIPAGLYVLRPSVEAPELRLEINTPGVRQPLHFALSPDASRLVFVSSGDGTQRLWLRSLGDAKAQPMAGTEEAEYPFWSADGRSIGFFAGGKLKRIDLSGGRPQTLADAPAGRGGAWNAEGTILFAPSNASPLWRVPASGGRSLQVTQLDLPKLGSHRLPQFLPDGRHFLFFAQGRAEEQGIFLGSLDNKDVTRLTVSDTAGAYTEPGLLLFNREGTLIARRLDVAAGTITGDPVTLADPVSYDGNFCMPGFSPALNGTVAYRAGGAERRQLTWFDRNGKTLGAAGEPDPNDQLGSELSPDGRRVAIARTVQNNADIWFVDILRGGIERITTDAARDQFPIWSPDGQHIAFSSNRKGVFNIYTKALVGTAAEQLVESTQAEMTLDWSRAGYLLYEEAGIKTGWDLWALPITGDRKPIAVSNTPFEERSGRFSPDGHWVAYQSNETGRFEIYVQPFPGLGVRSQVSTTGGSDPRWRTDGKELFFIAPDGKLMATPVRIQATSFEAGSPEPLFQTRVTTGGAAYLQPQYDISRDGRFLINMPLDGGTSPIVLILNSKYAPKK
jgi:serine/threonine protein kinase/Tol biopolymer transport system component